MLPQADLKHGANRVMPHLCDTSCQTAHCVLDFGEGQVSRSSPLWGTLSSSTFPWCGHREWRLGLPGFAQRILLGGKGGGGGGGGGVRE